MPSGYSDAQILLTCRDDPTFRATRSPYLIVDRDLCVIGANPAYCEVALREPGELDGRALAEVLPAGPGGSDAAGLLVASAQRVLQAGERDHLPLLRFAVPAPDGTPGAAERVLVAVNSPLRSPDGGRVIGVLHHAEDVTGLLDPDADGEGLAAVAMVRALDAENAKLRERFGRHVRIEQAKGALMARRHCSPEEAFDLLRELSHNTNTKLHLVAAALLEDTVHAPE